MLEVAAARSSARGVALLLIDFQRAFLDGAWAQRFGLADGDLEPIVQAVQRTVDLFESPSSPIIHGLPIMATRCFREPPQEAEPPEAFKGVPALATAPWVPKPTMDVTATPEFRTWLQNMMDGVALEESQPHVPVHTLVLGGCTTTSCVRVSSCAIARLFKPRGLRVVVDLSLCGARLPNYQARTGAEWAEMQPELCALYGGPEKVDSFSAVDLAIRQMEESGVSVQSSFDWA